PAHPPRGAPGVPAPRQPAHPDRRARAGARRAAPDGGVVARRRGRDRGAARLLAAQRVAAPRLPASRPARSAARPQLPLPPAPPPAPRPLPPRAALHPDPLVPVRPSARARALALALPDPGDRAHRHRLPARALAPLRMGALPDPHARRAPQPLLPATLEQPPAPPLQERALLVRRHDALRRRSARDGARLPGGGHVADRPAARGRIHPLRARRLARA